MYRAEGKRVAVVGLGAIANPPLVEFLVERGADVVACDRKTAAELGDIYERLAKLPISFRLGQDYLSGLTEFDTVYLTPAIRRDLPEIRLAKDAGVVFSSEILLFMNLCKSRKVGVTGSSGKTTTTTLIGEVFKQAGLATYVAGNIGVSLIKEVEDIDKHAWTVLELSSFQLQDFNISPDIAVVTNVTPNHLDYHSTMTEYIDAKRRIYVNQSPDGITILNWDDPLSRSMHDTAPGRVVFFSRLASLEQGVWLEGCDIVAALDGVKSHVCRRDEILLPGIHNLENVLAVSAVSAVAGVPLQCVRDVVIGFTGVNHRLQLVRTVNGVDYYNDSIATTPDRTMAALRAFDRPIVLIAGGYDKKLPFDDMAGLMPGRVKEALLIGKTAPLIREAIERANSTAEARLGQAEVKVTDCCSLEEAMYRAVEVARAGDVVLLSPACASYDMFMNFEERGQEFKDLVGAI